VWDCHTRRRLREELWGGQAQRLLLLSGSLDAALWRHPEVRWVAYEEVRRHTGTTAAHVWGALWGQLTVWADHNGRVLVPVGVGEAKKRLTGKGAATKADMVAAAEARWGGGIAEDEADALAVALAGLDRLGAP
jgi:Holliday junction resolvasome RuvABC endonuclease subunit